MKKTCLLALMVLASAAGASAADNDKNKNNNDKTAAAEQKPKDSRSDPNKVICHTDQETGSRTRVNRVCHTRAEWDELQQNVQKGINDMGRQENAGVQKSNGPIGL